MPKVQVGLFSGGSTGSKGASADDIPDLNSVHFRSRQIIAVAAGGQIPASVLWSPLSQAEDVDVASSIVEEDLTIEGNVRSDGGGVAVKGHVIGDVSADALTIQVGGSVNGALSAKQITIEGKHKGSLKCDDLRLDSSSIVQADIIARTMKTERGAKVVGNVKITGGE